MSLADRLRSLADALPEGASVTLTRAALLDLLADEGPAPDAPDLTVAEVARRTGRSASTVRRQLAAGELRGYRVGEKGDWRVPASALDDFRREAGAGEGLGAAARW